MMEWVQHDFDAREKDIPELLGLIRLPLLSPVVRCSQLILKLRLSFNQSIILSNFFTVYSRLCGKFVSIN